MSHEHYSLATQLAREIRSGDIRKRFESGEISSFDLAFSFGCDSTVALWALRLLAQEGLAEKIGEKGYGAAIYRIFERTTAVKIPHIKSTPLN